MTRTNRPVRHNGAPLPGKFHRVDAVSQAPRERGSDQNLSETRAATEAPTKNAKLSAWVEQIAELTQPDAIHWCDGSAEEYDRICQALVEAGTFEKLSDAKRPNSYLARSEQM